MKKWIRCSTPFCKGRASKKYSNCAKCEMKNLLAKTELEWREDMKLIESNKK